MQSDSSSPSQQPKKDNLIIFYPDIANEEEKKQERESSEQEIKAHLNQIAFLDQERINNASQSYDDSLINEFEQLLQLEEQEQQLHEHIEYQMKQQLHSQHQQLPTIQFVQNDEESKEVIDQITKTLENISRQQSQQETQNDYETLGQMVNVSLYDELEEIQSQNEYTMIMTLLYHKYKPTKNYQLSPKQLKQLKDINKQEQYFDNQILIYILQALQQQQSSYVFSRLKRQNDEALANDFRAVIKNQGIRIDQVRKFIKRFIIQEGIVRLIFYTFNKKSQKQFTQY